MEQFRSSEWKNYLHPTILEARKKKKWKVGIHGLKILGRVTAQSPVKIDFIYLQTSQGHFMLCAPDTIQKK